MRVTIRSCARHGLAYSDMKLQELKDLIESKVFEAMKEAVCNHRKSAGAAVDSDTTCIDLLVTASGAVEAVVTHYGKIHKVSANVEAWCEDVLRGLSWDEAVKEVKADNAPTFEEEYARHGESLFRPELQWHRVR